MAFAISPVVRAWQHRRSAARHRSHSPKDRKSPLHRAPHRRWLLGTFGPLLLVASGCASDDGEEGTAARAAATAILPASPAASGAVVAVAPATPPPGSLATAVPAEPARPQGPPVIPTAGASSDPFRSDAAELGPLVWATAIDPATNAPRAALAEVPTDAPTIYATLPAVWLRRGTMVTAVWSYNGTPLEGFVSTTSADRDQRGVWIEFHIERRGEAPWPEGTYAVEVLVDGTPAQRAAVLVRPSTPA